MILKVFFCLSGRKAKILIPLQGKRSSLSVAEVSKTEFENIPDKQRTDCVPPKGGIAFSPLHPEGEKAKKSK